jgi:hypothetical protein
MYASLFGISGALHLDVFQQPEHQVKLRLTGIVKIPIL